MGTLWNHFQVFKGLSFLQKVVILCRGTGGARDGEDVGITVEVSTFLVVCVQ